LLNLNVSKLNYEQRKQLKPFMEMLSKAKKTDDLKELMQMQEKVNNAIKEISNAS